MRISDWSSDVCSSDLVPLLRFNRHCGNGAGFQSSERDWLAGDFAIAIFAIVNPAQRCVDFRYELALAIASTKFDLPIRFAGSAVIKIGFSKRRLQHAVPCAYSSATYPFITFTPTLRKIYQF